MNNFLPQILKSQLQDSGRVGPDQQPGPPHGGIQLLAGRVGRPQGDVHQDPVRHGPGRQLPSDQGDH